jgi:hypothetical protein
VLRETINPIFSVKPAVTRLTPGSLDWCSVNLLDVGVILGQVFGGSDFALGSVDTRALLLDKLHESSSLLTGL